MFFNEDDVTTDGSDATTEVVADDTNAGAVEAPADEAPSTDEAPAA